MYLKLVCITLLILFTHAASLAQATAEVIPTSMIAQGNVHIPACYPRGTKAMISYINHQLKYPPKAKAEKRGGIVFVKFSVLTDGSLTNITVVLSPARDLSEEVLRVMYSMPKWIPAKTNGVNVESDSGMSIKFSPDK